MVIRCLALLLRQGKDSAIQQITERVLVKLTHWHVALLILVLEHVLYACKHVSRITTFHRVHVAINPCLLFGFYASVKIDFRLELLVCSLVLFFEMKAHFLNFGAVFEQAADGSMSFCSPKLLLVTCLLDRDLLKGCVWCEENCERLQSFIG